MSRMLNDYFKIPEGMSKQDIQEHINKQLSMERDNNLKQIKKEVEETLGGRFITDGSKIYYLVGACATHEDYYYVCLNSENQVWFLTCVGHIELINETCPDGFEYLISIIRGNPESVIEHVKKAINNSEIDVLFTPIIIENVKYENT